VMSTRLLGWEGWRNLPPTSRNGVLTASQPGTAVAYGLLGLQERGQPFVGPGTVVYEGMIVGLNRRPGDLHLNVTKQKQKTNIRSSTEDATVRLVPPRQMSLEECLDFIEDDELVEVTPKGIRMRKRVLNAGDRVLVNGPSGAGKSTLFRAIAGIWPWGSGEITLPERSRMMFMPQRPYLLLGSLRAALTYPAGVHKFSAATVRAALERCGLSHLVDRLNETERWDRVLSVGEQQRLAFGRVLLHKPDWVFMDEATSALDEEGQTAVLKLFQEELAGTTLVSIAHRPGVEAFHDRTLTLVMAVGGARLVTKRRQAVPRRSHASGKRSVAAVVLRPFRLKR